MIAVFGVLFVLLFVIVGVANGIGHPSVSSGDVAVVEDAPDGSVTQDDFNRSLKQTAARQGLRQVPKPSDPQYASLKDAAMSDALLTRWVLGEAADRGLTVSQTEISNQLQQVKQQSGSAAQFKQFLKQAGFTLADARQRIELQLLSNEIQKQVLPQNLTVPQSQVTNFYEANKSQFQQPETRDVREILNKDKAKVDKAKTLLSKDDSPQSWKKVAAKYSTDPATKDNGGLRSAVAQGQTGDVAFDQQVFSASQGELVGPFKGQSGYYLIEVEAVNPTQTTPLAKVQSQIQQQLTQGLQQQTATNFQQDFIDKWTERTFCSAAYVMDRCANFTAQDACNGDDPGDSGNVDKTGCPAVVPSVAPVSPGSATVFPGQTAQGAPQGPVGAGGPAAVQQQPGVIGPGGAPQLPPGAPPQGGAPPPQASP